MLDFSLIQKNNISSISNTDVMPQKVWGFTQKVFDVVRRIPKGKVLTYKEVARRVGSPNAQRAVGNVLAKNYNPDIPCHRVIGSTILTTSRSPSTLTVSSSAMLSRVGGYNRGRKKKIRLLRKERAFKDFV